MLSKLSKSSLFIMRSNVFKLSSDAILKQKKEMHSLTSKNCFNYIQMKDPLMYRFAKISKKEKEKQKDEEEKKKVK